MGITAACEFSDVVVMDFTAGPVYMDNNKKGCHEWIIECNKIPSNPELFTETLDITLRKLNSDYDAKRKGDLALGMPIVHFVQEGTFYHWMERRGKLGGQHKVPR